MKKRKTRAQRSRSFRCPHCGAAMILRPASEIYHDAKSDRKLYVCHNYPACNTYVAAHPNTDKPMGVPANGNLRNLRIQAHRKFDLMPTYVRIESAGKRSTALCEQISSVDVSRLGDFKGHLTDREMAQVDVALMASLDLHPIPRQAKVRPVVPDVDDAALALIALRFLEGFLQKRCGVTVQDRLSIDLLGQKND